MDSRFCLLVFIFCMGLFSVREVNAQIVPEKVSYQHSSMELYGRISDTTRLGAVPLAHILIWHEKDTTKLVSNLVGRFTYKGRLADTMQVQVTALGFKPFIGQYIPKKHGLDICIQLQQEDIVLDEVIITGKRLMMVVKGDTLQYNVDEVKTLEGAKMGEILEKLPGVSMDGGLKVNGMPIHRIYVNGDTLFKGTEALNHITADNVKNVKVFDERNKEDLEEGLRYGRRERVMDVTTKKTVSREEIAKTMIREQKRNTFMIGGGLDASRDRTSKFPEKLLLKYVYEEGKPNSLGVTNAKRFSVDYSNLFLNDKREFGGEFLYSKRFGKLSYRSQYAYRNSTTYSNRWDEQNYFPTERYDSRYYGQTSSDKNSIYEYKTTQSLGFRIKKIDFNFSGKFNYGVGKNWATNWMLSTLNGEVINSADVQDYNRKYSSDGNFKFTVSTKPSKGMSLKAESVLNISAEGRTGWQMDTLKSSNRHINLARDWDNDILSWRTNLQFSKKISPLYKLFLIGMYSYSESTSKGIGEDRVTGLLDTNNTRNYTWYNNSVNIDGTLTYYGNRVEISGGGIMKYVNRNQIERFHKRRQVKDHFLHFDPKLYIKATFSPLLNLSLNYSSNTILPSAIELRAEIDDTNPLNLKVGNPNLKLTRKHILEIQCNKSLPRLASALESSIVVEVKQNPIVLNSRYFTEVTYLSEYAYTIARGATLHTYENSDPEYSLKAKVGFEKFWPFLGKCRFTPSYERRVVPSFTQGERNDLRTDNGEFDIKIWTNFSKKVKLNINSTIGYGCSDSRLGSTNEFLHENISIDATTMVIPKFIVRVGIDYNYHRNLTIQREENNTMLNISISRDLGKYLSMALNGVNLLDVKKNQFLGRTAEYELRKGQNQTGRYITLNLNCRF